MGETHLSWPNLSFFASGDWWASVVLTLLALAFAGYVGTVAYNLMARFVHPALRAALTILTFNTQKARDQVYSLASNRPVSSLAAIILLLAALIVASLSAEAIVKVWLTATKVGGPPSPQVADLRDYSFTFATVWSFGFVVITYLLIRLIIVYVQAIFAEIYFLHSLTVISPALRDDEYPILMRRFSLCADEGTYKDLLREVAKIGAQRGYPLMSLARWMR